ncbi:MAG TPA: hypothetical protein VF463_18205 [Sphingobium sp.]
MADEIDTRISPTLHPGIDGVIADYDADTRPLLGAAETAISEAFEALKSIHEAKAGAAKNPTLNEYAQLVQVDDYATKRMVGRVWPMWDRARDTLDNNIARFEQELRAPVEQRATGTMGSEIRAYFRGMEKETQRFGALRQAIAEGDDVTVTAVLGARPYLSGIDAETSEMLLQEWHERAQPVKAKQLRAMKATAAIIAEREPLLKKSVQDAIGYIDEFKTSQVDGRPILAKRTSAREVRDQMRAAQKPFSVPV